MAATASGQRGRVRGGPKWQQAAVADRAMAQILSPAGVSTTRFRELTDRHRRELQLHCYRIQIAPFSYGRVHPVGARATQIRGLPALQPRMIGSWSMACFLTVRSRCIGRGQRWGGPGQARPTASAGS